MLFLFSATLSDTLKPSFPRPLALLHPTFRFAVLSKIFFHRLRDFFTALFTAFFFADLAGGSSVADDDEACSSSFVFFTGLPGLP